MEHTSSPERSRTVIFDAKEITRVYRMGEVEVYALRGTSLRLYEGEFVVLVGPSGSGKSTLLNILGALDLPTSGQVFFRDQELTSMSDAQLTRFRRSNVGFVFQFYNLIPSLTAEENVALVTEICSQPMEPRQALSWLAWRIDAIIFLPIVGRRAAAGGDCSGDRQATWGAAVRRANRALM